MTASHRAILDELYGIDPALREHEAELVPLLHKLLAKDPAQKPSAAFVKKLRKELAARAAAMESGAVEHRVSYASPSGFFQRFSFAMAGAVAAVVIAVPVTLRFAHDAGFAPTEPGDETAMMDARDSVTTPMPAPTASYARGQGGGGGDVYGDGKMAAANALIAPWNPVRYTLEGDLPELPSDVTVLERNPSKTRVAFSAIASTFANPSVDLSSFANAEIDSFGMTQRQQFGYSIYVSVADGTVSINQAWDQWPHPETECRDDACYRRMQPKIGDIPADADLIRIASAFLAEHKVSLSGYGDPVVDTAWRTQYDAAPDKSMAWVPDAVRVIFPLIVDGKTVYEAGGDPAGISVQVSVKHKRVSDAWGITAYSFDSEKHGGVTDRADVEKFLGMTGSQTPDAATVTLSNPTQGLVHLYVYENGSNRELFVPALVFAVNGVPPELGYAPQAVMVPLAKDLLDEVRPPIMIDPMPVEPMPRPMDGDPAVDVPADEPLMMEKKMQ